MSKRDKYSELRAKGRLYGTLKRARELARRRASACFQRTPPPLTVEARTVVIPLSGALSAELVQWSHDLHPLRSNWEHPAASTSRGRRVCEIDNGRYSSRCTYTLWTYRPETRCCGRACGRWLLWFCEDQRRWLRAPRGWVFGQDRLGLYVVRRSEKRIRYRFHFDSASLRSIRTLHNAALDHEHNQRAADREQRERKRRQREREAEIQRAMGVGVYVGLRDSVRAGNCPAGSRTWAKNHGLDARQYYPIAVIRRLANVNGNRHQVERACEAAIDRTVRDMERGFCEL